MVSGGAPIFDIDLFQAQLFWMGRPKHDIVYFGANAFYPKAF